MNPFFKAQSTTDEQLMEKYQQGDYMAFEALYFRHEKTVFSYLSKRLQDENARSEVFQNIFMKFHKSKDLYNSDHAFLKWLYTISRSELYDFCKKKKLETIPFDETLFTPEEPKESDLDISDYKNLSDSEKKAIELRFYSDHDYSEISKLLDTSQSNARKLVSRGLKKIKKKMMGGSNE